MISGYKYFQGWFESLRVAACILVICLSTLYPLGFNTPVSFHFELLNQRFRSNQYLSGVKTDWFPCIEAFLYSTCILYFKFVGIHASYCQLFDFNYLVPSNTEFLYIELNNSLLSTLVHFLKYLYSMLYYLYGRPVLFIV